MLSASDTTSASLTLILLPLLSGPSYSPCQSIIELKIFLSHNYIDIQFSFLLMPLSSFSIRVNAGRLKEDLK